MTPFDSFTPQKSGIPTITAEKRREVFTFFAHSLMGQFLMSDEEFYGKNDERRSRSAEKAERVANETAMLKLIRGLLDLKVARLPQLNLSDDTLRALSAARKLDASAARDRAIKYVRSFLRQEDWETVLRNFERLQAGYAMADAEEAPHVLWATRLILEGDPALARFCQEYSEADRRRIRQLMRGTLRVQDERKARAREILEVALETAIRISGEMDAMKKAKAALLEASGEDDDGSVDIDPYGNDDDDEDLDLTSDGDDGDDGDDE